jgi:hypothetical protein
LRWYATVIACTDSGLSGECSGREDSTPTPGVEDGDEAEDDAAETGKTTERDAGRLTA